MKDPPWKKAKKGRHPRHEPPCHGVG